MKSFSPEDWYSQHVLFFCKCMCRWSKCKAQADRMNESYSSWKSMFFSFFLFAAALSKYSVFLIFRYKQSLSGNDAEMNIVAECNITIPSSPMVVGKERGRERERRVKWGRRRTEGALGWVEWKICEDREQYGRRWLGKMDRKRWEAEKKKVGAGGWFKGSERGARKKYSWKAVKGGKES